MIRENAGQAVAERFWLAERAVTDLPDLVRPLWQRPGHQFLNPLVPAGILQGSLK